MSTGDDIPDRRERCGRLQPVPCGAWDEDHEDICANCRAPYDSALHRFCDNKRRHQYVLCPDGNGEFERMTRPSHDD